MRKVPPLLKYFQKPLNTERQIRFRFTLNVNLTVWCVRARWFDKVTFGAFWHGKSRHFTCARWPLKGLHLLLCITIIFLHTSGSAVCFTFPVWTWWLFSWHLAAEQQITPILNVKQIWHGALIVNNLVRALRSVDRRTSTFSSLKGLLFSQMLSCLRLRQVSPQQRGTPLFLIELSPWLSNLTYNASGMHPRASRNTHPQCRNSLTWMITRVWWANPQ